MSASPEEHGHAECTTVKSGAALIKWLAQKMPRASCPMWTTSIAWWEFVVRGTLVYVFLLFLLRATGKRQVGQLSPFDLILLLILSDGVQNAINAGDTSVTGAVIVATTLVLLNHCVGLITYRYRDIETWIEGKPEVLVRNGVAVKEVMNRQHISQMELESAVRQAGCRKIEDVELAIFENNGHISVFTRKEA